MKAPKTATFDIEQGRDGSASSTFENQGVKQALSTRLGSHGQDTKSTQGAVAQANDR